MPISQMPNKFYVDVDGIEKIDKCFNYLPGMAKGKDIEAWHVTTEIGEAAYLVFGGKNTVICPGCNNVQAEGHMVGGNGVLYKVTICNEEGRAYFTRAELTGLPLDMQDLVDFANTKFEYELIPGMEGGGN